MYLLRETKVADSLNCLFLFWSNFSSVC